MGTARLGDCGTHLIVKNNTIRYLGSHENLPDVGSSPLICLGRGTVQGEENQHGGEGAEGHGHGEEGARALEQG